MGLQNLEVPIAEADSADPQAVEVLSGAIQCGARGHCGINDTAAEQEVRPDQKGALHQDQADPRAEVELRPKREVVLLGQDHGKTGLQPPVA